MDTRDIDNRFVYHPPSQENKIKHEDIRVRAAELAHAINVLVPEGREKSLAITKLEEAMFWANAGIARSPDAPSN